MTLVARFAMGKHPSIERASFALPNFAELSGSALDENAEFARVTLPMEAEITTMCLVTYVIGLVRGTSPISVRRPAHSSIP